MKKNFTEIEEIIENRIAQLSEEYDLDRYDIEDIGWMEEGCHYRSMEEQLAEVGMSMRDFF